MSAFILSACGLIGLLFLVFLEPAGARGVVSIPIHGPLSKRPTVKHHMGPPPARLVTRDLIRGVGPRATNGEVLTVDYVGAFYRNGKMFDSSWSRHEPFVFPLGRGEVIEGWERGLIGMRVGGRRELVVPASLAYGKKGSPPTIPPNSTLVFVVDLLASSIH
ncbi:MAG TPA: FKBP-type peptidyl-prolyl cis-trans isomerase [Solirubrobacteraceae bacterium]|nr:FKBP-type peptidyl-prolyl cis-trans isomerase [Solirubrobacteraceae bacterium]